jgi:hypothetical protein
MPWPCRTGNHEDTKNTKPDRREDEIEEMQMTIQPQRNQFIVSIFFVFFVALWFVLPDRASCAGTGRISLVKTPHGGIQPQAAVDGRGVLHLV